MKKFTLLIFIFFIPFFQSIYACSCIGPTSFCESITNSDGTLYPKFVLRGWISDASSAGFEIQIDEMLYGDLNQSEIILKHSFCDLYMSELEAGKEYIFALSDYDNDFSLVPCAISFLKIEDEVVKGKIAPGVESIDYYDLVTLEGCGNQFDFFSIENNMLIFPNPTNDILKIKNTSLSDSVSNVQIQFIDMIGRELYTLKKEDEFFAGETWKVNLENFTAGVYFLKLTANSQETVIKIVKQ